MRFTVIWNTSTLGKLADIWVHAADREAINRAASDVDRMLRDDPGRHGEDYYGDRILDVGVLVSPIRSWRTIELPPFLTSG